MSDQLSRIAKLPLERRALLEVLLKNSAGLPPKKTIPHLLRTKGKNSFPLSFAQQRLWFFDQLQPNSTAYNLHQAVRIVGDLNVQALRTAFHQLVRRHESLRTTFDRVEDIPVQVIAEPPTSVMRILDLSTVKDSRRESEALRLITEEAQRPFNLAYGPLLRVTLLKLSDQQHLLSITLHHIVTDAWSMGLLMCELKALYAAFCDGQPSPLPELPIQYSDFAVWQRLWLQGEELENKLSYWRAQLQNLPLLELPTDRPRPPVQTFRGAAETALLSPALSLSIKELGRNAGVTLFMTLVAAFQLLLSRLSGQVDIVLGTPIANRNRAEIEGLIGFFVNTLVLRTDLSGNPTFLQLLALVKETALAAYANQDLPFEKLVEELQPARDLSRTPLFQVLINMVSFADSSLELRGLAVEKLFSIPPEAKFDLTLYVTQSDPGITFRLTYNADLFDHERIVEMLRQFEWLLQQIVDAPEAQIGSYSLVTPDARRILPDPNISLPEPKYEPASKTFLGWAQKTPQQPAVSQGQRTWSYDELAEDARTLAHVVLAKGLQPGEVVAVMGPRSYGLIASAVAVFLSRGVLLVIDPALPEKRQRLMLREAGARQLLYIGGKQSKAEWLLQQLSPNFITYVKANESPAVEAAGLSLLEAKPLPEPDPSDPAYIFFTSGTTGIPKGVLGCQKGLNHFLHWQRETFSIGPQERCAQMTNLSFDAVLRDIFLPLTSGATLCLPELVDEIGAKNIIPWLQQAKVSLLHIVPSLAQCWLSDLPAGVSLPDLRWVFFTGEPLTNSLVRRWRQAFPESGELINLYGPTETTLVKCYYRVPEPEPPGVQPVGWPLPETQALVLSASNRLCGLGEVGEIVLRTPFRTLGYLNAFAENKQRFVRNPFREDDQDLLYYTGDRGRYRTDGCLEILGRLDHQVKIRGFRIELGEVETLLAAHPAVQATVVLAREDVPGEKLLVAYLVPFSGQAVSSSELRRFLNQQLPDYMVPSVFVIRDALPRTPNGKVDRSALPPPDQHWRETEKSFLAPRTRTEELVAKIWVEVLKAEQVGVDDNFFELGGHSLSSTMVLSRIRDAFKVELPLRRFFEVPTVAGLSQEVEQALAGGLPLDVPALKSVSNSR